MPRGSADKTDAPGNAARLVSAAEVRKAVAELERRHRQGRALAKKFAVTKDGSAVEAGAGPMRAERYASPGHAAFAALAREENIPAAELLARRRFFLTYTRDELAGLCDRRTPDGLPLAWGVVRALLRVPDRAERAKIEARAAAEGLSAAWVRSLVTGGRPAAKAGRKVKPPVSPEAGLAAAAADARRLKSFLDALGSKVRDVAKEERRRAKAAGRVAAAARREAAAAAARKAELATAADASLRELAAAIEAIRETIHEVFRPLADVADRPPDASARDEEGGRAGAARKRRR